KASVLEDQAESGLSSGGLRARGIADEWRDRGTTCWRTDRGIGGGRTDRGSSGGLRARGIADEWRDRGTTCWRTDRGIGGGRMDRGSSGGLRARGIADEWRDRDQTGGCETLTGNVAQGATAKALNFVEILRRLSALFFQVANLFASVAPFEAATRRAKGSSGNGTSLERRLESGTRWEW